MEMFTSADIFDQVSLEDCKVRKINPVKRAGGNHEIDSSLRIASLQKDDFRKVGQTN